MHSHLSPGMHDAIAAERYHADALTPEPSLSSSGARRLLATCPAKFWHERNSPPQPSTALRVGSAAHEWILEGDRWPQHHYVLPENFNRAATRKQAAEIAAAEEAEAAGKRLITADEFAAIKAMHAALAAHEYAMQAFTDGLAEQTLIWKDPEFGIWCRARPDYLRIGLRLVPEYKSTIDASPDALPKTIARWGYHAQAAWVLDGLEQCAVVEGASFIFFFQEKDPPYLVAPAVLDPQAMGWGRVQNRKAKEVFARCLERDEWPGYSDDIITIGLPRWAELQLQDQHEAGAFQTQEIAA